MRDINKETFVCIDCETTGLDPKEDRIIEIACVSFSAETIFHRFESLIDPERHITEESIKIHHITQEMVKGKPKIADVIPQILEVIGNKIIVGHGVGFDIDIMAIAADRAKIKHELKKNTFFDTLRLARHYGESPVNSLEQLRKHFNIQPEGAHRAMSDVIVNVEVFKHLVRKFKTVDQVKEVLSRPIKLRSMPLGKHKGRPLNEIPLEYLRWAAHKNFDQDLLFSLRSEINKRKKGNLFSQAGNPFQQL